MISLMVACLSLSSPYVHSSKRKLAIVTGGTRGIGKAITFALLDEGYDVIATYCGDTEAAHELQKKGNRILCVRGDLTRIVSRDHVFKQVDLLSSTHRLESLVHCAGQYVGLTSTNSRGLSRMKVGYADGSPPFGDDEGKVKHFRYYVELYGEAFIDLSERAVQRMSGGGSIVGISSPGCSLLYNPNLGYDFPGSGKAVMEYASRLIASRVAAHKINCNIVVPGVTPTDAWKRISAERGVDDASTALAEKISPMGKTLASEVASVVAFLCSEKGKIVTGCVVPADKGVHLRI